MKILITGYKGFIGQNMVNALKDEHELSLYEWGDDPPEFEGLDWCIHLGAITSTTETDVEKVMRQNHDFSCMILMACQINNVSLQYASSASVYGPSMTFSEDSPKLPQSPYAWSKYFFDRQVQSQKYNNIKVQGFRYFNVYGPHEDHKGDQASPYYKFEKQAKETGVIKIFEGSDKFARDFIPVEQVIETHKKFFDINQSGIWNLGTGRATTFEAVARMIADKYNARVEYIPMPANIARQYQAYTCADLTRLRAALDANNG